MALEYKSSLLRYRRYLQTVQQQPLWQASIFVILSLALIIVLLVSALRPTLITIAGLLGQIRQESKLEKRMDTKIATIQSAQQEYQRVEGRLPTLEAALPSSPDWADFAANIYQLATDSAMQIESISLRPMSNKSVNQITLPAGINGMQFSMTVTGGYNDLKKLGKEIGMMSRVVVWTNLSINRIKENKLNLTASGVIGYTPPNGKP